ncbi:30S ribosomal protein S20 [bacterium CG10_46_32]|nr:MAG: 30S ribosomal protein S20 [bacterium CG10_46_32]PIR56205.1 MAG: 30S ribosomal protein S20 [Parcubacteria group bacterium CG10_big_fil_rev_8_21_14_0_10_46_32]
MPIKKSSFKELRKTKTRTLFNKIREKKIKDTLKKIQKALTIKNLEEAQKLAQSVVGMIDKAAKRNIIHPNKAARKKSRMFAAIKKASAK